jgi:glycosyltransferase involved in cell wall biosynthesis
MRVLHICSDFANQKLYNELISNMERACAVEQFVYVPVRSRAEVDGNRNESLADTQYRFAHILRPYHRILFRRKVNRVLRDLTAAADVRSFSVAHAHFLYSDGAVALGLKREYGLPYIVAVRNTDLNFFMRYRPDLFRICREILRQAYAVIFVSPAYREKLLARLPDHERDAVSGKSHIVPNGVASFWLDHPPQARIDDHSSLRLLYVGDFTHNKNVPGTIRASEILVDNCNAKLTLVGGGGSGAEVVSRMLASGRHPQVTFVGRIDDLEKLMEIYRQHDIFVMPSFLETFGLSYIEALSQGLPVVHSRGQGIDGYFDHGTVSEAADPRDPASIAAAVQTLVKRLPDIRALCIDNAKRFDWQEIAEIYAGLYKKAKSPRQEISQSTTPDV